MRKLLKVAALCCLFIGVAGVSGYLTLRLVVSQDTVVVPDLLGKDAVYALDILTDLGLNIKVSGFEYTADIPENHIAHQDPEPGVEIKKDRDVRIILSKGPQTLLAPDLVGLVLRQANIIMEENGLSRGVLSRAFDDRAAVDEVASQAPMPGAVVKRGDPVDLLVSLGSRPVTYKMPYLEGIAFEDAIIILDRIHLGPGQIHSVQRDDFPKGVVVAQDPQAGRRVASRTLVNLTINRPAEGPILDRGLALFSHHVPEGLLRRHIRIRVNSYGMLYDLLDFYAGPGEEVWFVAPQHPQARIFVYEDEEIIAGHSSNHRPRVD